MGWTNSHLHQFEIKGKRYGDPELLLEDYGDDQEVCQLAGDKDKPDRSQEWQAVSVPVRV